MGFILEKKGVRFGMWAFKHLKSYFILPAWPGRPPLRLYFSVLMVSVSFFVI